MTRDILVYSDDGLIGEVNVPEGEPAWFEYSHSWLEKHVKTVSSSRKVHLRLPLRFFSREMGTTSH